MSNGLVVIADKALGPSVAKELRRGLSKPEILVELVESEQEAMSRLSTSIPYDLVVVHIDIPADGNNPSAPGGFRGIELLKWLHAKSPEIPVILMVQSIDPHITAAVANLPRSTCVVSEGMNLPNELIRAAKDSLTNPKRLPDEHLNLTITVNDADHTWTWDMAGAYSGFGVLEVDNDEIAKLAAESNLLYRLMSTGSESSEDEEPVWLQQLSILGARLLQGIFCGNVAFWGQFCAGRAKVDEDHERINICFRTTSKIHDIALEAISSKEIANQFWMLSSPIYRWIGVGSSSYRPLFSNPGSSPAGKINCLIIEANASGETTFPGNLIRDFPQLERAKDECDQIEKYFVDHQGEFEIGRTLRISSRILGGESFEDFLIKTLRLGPWHLIHFVGHSFFHQKQGKGYILLPNPSENGPPVPLPIEEFGTYLRQTRFLYLSSCQSARREFLVSMAKCKVPALIGFTCPVYDEHAEKFAVKFYQELFTDPKDVRGTSRNERDQNCVQQAFVRTRKSFHREMPNETIWAQPILMLQSD